MWSVVTLIILISWIWYHVRYRKFLKLSEQLKTDIKAWPLIGHAHVMFGNSVDRMKGVQQLGLEANKHGGITYMWLGSYYAVVVTDPEDLEVITKTCLDKGDILEFLKDFFGSGSVIAPVSIWRPRRKFLASIFTVKNLNSFVSIFNEKSRNMVDKLRAEAGKGTFTFWQYITTFSMDSLCETTLGICMDTNSQEHQGFLKSFDVCMDLSAERIFKPLFQINFIYRRLSRYKKFVASRNIMYGFIHSIIESKKEALKGVERKPLYVESKEDRQSKKCWKSILELQIVSGEKYGFTTKVIGEETLVLVLAGTESSANCLSYTAVLLSQHPEVQEKAYQEIQNVLEGADRDITVEDLPKLKYLDAVLRESLRLYPPFPVTVRKVNEKVTLRVTLEAGCVVLCHIWGAHRNGRQWGGDPNTFRPERFLCGEPAHPAAFMAFSLGQRNCIGYQYAMMSMKTAVATLLRHYRLMPAASLAEGAHPPLTTEYNFIMKDVDRYKLKLELRGR